MIIPDELPRDSRDILFIVPWWGEAPDNIMAGQNSMLEAMANMGGPYKIQFISSDIKLMDYKELPVIDKLPGFDNSGDEVKKAVDDFNENIKKGIMAGEKIAKKEDLQNSPINRQLAEDINKEIGANK